MQKVRVSCPLESVEQQHLINWAKYQKLSNGGVLGSYLFAIPNGGSRAKQSRNFSFEGMSLKREGVKAGVPDLMLAIPRRGYHGLFIEMKRRDKSKSHVSDAQKTWHERLKGVGYKVIVAYGADEAKDAIIEYMT